MALTYKSSAIPASFASCSFLSPRSGNLADRMRALHEAGFDGMELSMPDLLSYGAALEGRHLDDTDENIVMKTALQVRKLAADLGLKIVMLQPFAQFEGWPKHSSKRREAFDRAERWFKVMAAVGTDMLQVHGMIFLVNLLRLLTPDRLVLLMPKGYPQTWTNTLLISPNWPTLPLLEAFASPMRTGAGQPTPPTGRMSGKS